MLSTCYVSDTVLSTGDTKKVKKTAFAFKELIIHWRKEGSTQKKLKPKERDLMRHDGEVQSSVAGWEIKR